MTPQQLYLALVEILRLYCEENPHTCEFDFPVANLAQWAFDRQDSTTYKEAA